MNEMLVAQSLYILAKLRSSEGTKEVFCFKHIKGIAIYNIHTQNMACIDLDILWNKCGNNSTVNFSEPNYH